MEEGWHVSVHRRIFFPARAIRVLFLAAVDAITLD